VIGGVCRPEFHLDPGLSLAPLRCAQGRPTRTCSRPALLARRAVPLTAQPVRLQPAETTATLHLLSAIAHPRRWACVLLSSQGPEGTGLAILRAALCYLTRTCRAPDDLLCLLLTSRCRHWSWCIASNAPAICATTLSTWRWGVVPPRPLVQR
jgi:hypothetical protein